MVITFRQKNPLMPTVRLRYGNSAELYRPASLFRLAIGCSIYYGQSPGLLGRVAGRAQGYLSTRLYKAPLGRNTHIQLAFTRHGLNRT